MEYLLIKILSVMYHSSLLHKVPIAQKRVPILAFNTFKSAALRLAEKSRALQTQSGERQKEIYGVDILCSLSNMRVFQRYLDTNNILHGFLSGINSARISRCLYPQFMLSST